MKATCSHIEDKLEVGPQFNQLMVHLSHYTKRLATMRTGYEYLATMSTIVQRHFQLVVGSVGELDWPHEALKTGYTQAGLRRIVLSHLDFID